MALKELPVLEHKAHRVLAELKELMAHKELLVLMELKVLLDQEHKAHKVLLEPMVLKAQQVRMEHKEPLVMMAHKEHRV
jgi:hypothetical protein